MASEEKSPPKPTIEEYWVCATQDPENPNHSIRFEGSSDCIFPGRRVLGSIRVHEYDHRRWLPDGSHEPYVRDTTAEHVERIKDNLKTLHRYLSLNCPHTIVNQETYRMTECQAVHLLADIAQLHDPTKIVREYSSTVAYTCLLPPTAPEREVYEEYMELARYFQWQLPE